MVLFFLLRNHCLKQEAVYLGDPYFTSWCIHILPAGVQRAVLSELAFAGVRFPLARQVGFVLR